MGAVGQADRGRAAADLLHGDDMLEVAHFRAAVFFGNGDTQEAHVAHLSPQFGRKMVIAVNIGGQRGDFLGDEILYRFAQQVGGFTQAKVQREEYSSWLLPVVNGLG